jgi:magnesium transporter
VALQVSTSNLERVRRIKNRLVRLTTRVQTLREMLEKLMDDDSDMHAMHLTARAYDQLERQVGLLIGSPRWLTWNVLLWHVCSRCWRS